MECHATMTQSKTVCAIKCRTRKVTNHIVETHCQNQITNISIETFAVTSIKHTHIQSLTKLPPC